MPKNERVRSASSKRFKAPYRNNSKQKESENLSGPKEDVIEWEEARCPICMEHPHSAVLLRCSSSKNGCRPYMCNTGHRHSNCLNEFFNKFSVISSTNEPQELPLSEAQEVPLSSTEAEEAPDPPSIEPEELNWSCGNQSEPKLECPLCRGQITGWVVVEPARRFMNAKSRSCSYETCDFIGNYPELRKHARLEHPSVRPWEVDQKRNRDWKWLEYTRDIQDVLSAIQSEFIDFSSGEINLSAINEHWATLTLLARST